MYTMEFGDITKENMMKAFEAAAIVVDADEEREDTLYLTEGLEFPIWLHIYKENKQLS